MKNLKNKNLYIALIPALFITLILVAAVVTANIKKSEINVIDKGVSSIKLFEPQSDSSEVEKFTIIENDIRWDVSIKDGKIIELTKDGDRISESEIEKYRPVILKKLKNLSSRLDGDNDNIKVKSDRIKIKIDKEKLSQSMAQLKDDLKKLEKINIHIRMDDKDWNMETDGEEFKEEMEKLAGELEKLGDMDLDFDFDIDVDIDPDEIRIDLSGLKEGMCELKENMKDLKIEMKELKTEMKKLKAFLDESKSELVKDGYISDEKEEFDMELSTEKMSVNGKEVPEEIHKKHLELYKKHFNQELENKIKIKRD